VIDPTEPAAVLKWLAERRHLLLVTHIRPDGDAFGSLTGLLTAFARAGRSCVAYLSTPPPRRLEPLLLPAPGLSIGVPPPLADVDGIVCLDVANWERADLPPGIPSERGRVAIPVCNIDHHSDNTRFGDLNLVQADMPATAQVLAELLAEAAIDTDAAAATRLLVGLLMDCGGFRFRNTGPAALRGAASLIEGGADYHRVVDRLFFSEPMARLRYKAKILADARPAHGGKLLYAILDPAEVKAFGVQLADTEDVIDVLRVIEGVEIACLLQPDEGAVRFSLRGRSERYPVDVIAHELGGGGHRLAAGAKVGNISLSAAADLLVAMTGKVLQDD